MPEVQGESSKDRILKIIEEQMDKLDVKQEDGTRWLDIAIYREE